jgi:hypothetical protein
MELFLHSAGQEDPELVEIEASALVRELVVSEEDGHVWVEEAEEELDLDITLEAAGIRHRHHVHRGRCHRVEVTVRFAGREIPHSFAPAATIKRVFTWATGKDEFDLSPEQRAKHVLALPGADHFLAWTVHVGSLVTPGDCAVLLDLAAEESFEG